MKMSDDKRMKKAKAFAKALRDLMIKHGIEGIGAEIDGDTHGISSDFILWFSNDRRSLVISCYETAITRSDLKDFYK